MTHRFDSVGSTMDESGISMGFDDQILLDNVYLDAQELIAQLTPPDLPDCGFYELRSKTVPAVAESPSFKSEMVSTRTQIRQQLQREKTLQEEQRKKQEVRPMTGVSSGEPLRVPASSIPSTVPSHVLEVTTKLENPTKYHMIAKRQNQVLKYLSTSFNDESDMEVGNNTQSAPVVKTELTKTRQSRQSSSSYSGLYSPEQPSPSVGSVATSISDAEEVLEGILSFEESHSLFGTSKKQSVQKNKTSSCPSGLQQFDDPKDKVKKENHNIIERRRRCNINDRIKELGDLLPKMSDRHYDILRDSKTNKGTILKASVDFIKVLKNDTSKLKKYEVENKQLLDANRQLLLRIKELELHAKRSGVPLTNCTWKVADPETILNTYIKAEPGVTSIHIPDVVAEEVCIHDELIEEMEEDNILQKDAMLYSPLSHKSSSSAGSYAYDDVDMQGS